MESLIDVCGNCKHFKSHHSKTKYANGYWLGDGKCKYQKVTMVGDTCKKHQKRLDLFYGCVILQRMKQ